QRVLVVEDNNINQDLASAILARIGLDVLAVSDGKTALEKMHQGYRPDLILMDLQLPGMNGIETTKLISKEFNPSPVIIALTSNKESNSRRQCLEAGMADFIEKPLRILALKEVLPKHLPLLHFSENAEFLSIEPHQKSEFRFVDVTKIDQDYRSCWDIFFKLYRDFVIYYQHELPKVEKLIKDHQGEAAKLQLKEFHQLARHFYPYHLKDVIEECCDQVSEKKYELGLKTFI